MNRPNIGEREAWKWKGEIWWNMHTFCRICRNIPKITQVLRHRSSSTWLLLLVWSDDVLYFTNMAWPLELRLLHMHIVWKTLSIISTFFGSLWHPKKCSVPSLDKPLCKLHMYVIPLATLSTFSTLPPWCPFQSVEILMSCCCLPLVVPGIFATSRTCQSQRENIEIYITN